jgi:DNA polymerase-3 subunit epsilon
MSGFFSGKSGRRGVAIGEAGYVVVDTELTGLDPRRDSIISVGAVKMLGNRIDLGTAFYRLINPSSEMGHEGIVVHGITPSEVSEKPPIEDVLSEFIDYCGDNVIVGHFISIDMDFLNREIKRVRGESLKNSLADTCSIYEWINMSERDFSGYRNGGNEDLNLFSIARKFGVEIKEAHNALSDAFITAQLFQRFLSLLPGTGVKTLGDLLKIGKP